MKKIKYFALIAALLGVAYWYLCPKKVDVALVTRGQAVSAVYATGTVESTEMLPVSPRVGGRLAEIFYDEGSEVSEGEVLARLESEENEANLMQMKSRLKLLEGEFNRQKVLFEKNATSRDVFERARSEFEVANGAYQAELARKDYLLLKAPKDGRVIRRDGELGQYLGVNQEVFWFASSAPLRITAEVDEEDIVSVKSGQKVLIRSDAFSDEVFKGEVLSVTPKGDPVARSYRVRIGFTEPTPLMIGMTVENNIILREEPNALLVPSGAVLKGQVWVVKEGVLVNKKVRLGAQGADKVEILEGLKESEKVLLNPSFEYRDGMRVRARERS